MKKITLISLILLFLPLSNIFAQLYMSNALVSYYAEDFHGKRTSNGEIFNMYDYTCASKSLPFNTKLKITNNKNSKSVIVRVNDRGPFVPDRVLDLSKAAAIKLDMIKDGTARVKIEIIERGPDTKLSSDTARKANQLMTQRFGADWNKSSKSSAKSKSSSNNQSKNKKTLQEAPENAILEIQLASFSKKENAQAMAKKLYKLGYRNIFIRSNGEIFRLVLKKIPKSQIRKMEEKLKKDGFNDYIIRIGQ
ncbi:MAG: septal ring lytic transglycosylase RlpA family protein [Treponema sp.]|nr:septal ring lytic transglycosylase RlpA family protein [Treponema sp.]